MDTISEAYGNAVIESFWARMHTELLDRRRWTTRLELANVIFEYPEIFHNRQRRTAPWVGAPYYPRRNLDAGLTERRLRRSGTVRISSYFRSL
jgi:hypothetical protein